MAGNPKIKGQQLWKLRKTHGREKIYSNPDAIWKGAVKYFEWCEQNPIAERTGTKKDDGSTSHAKVTLHIRAMTIEGLSLHLGITPQTWRNYRKEDQFKAVCSTIESIMYEQKFTGAAAGVFKESIISRDLGLTEKHDLGIGRSDDYESPIFNVRFIHCDKKR